MHVDSPIKSSSPTVGELLMGFKCFWRFQWDPRWEVFLTLMNTFSGERQIGKIVSCFAKPAWAKYLN